jgi:flagellum-specific ATP synthase
MLKERLSLRSRLSAYAPSRLANVEPQAEGRITRSVGLTLEAVGLNVCVGSQCEVINNDGRRIEVEVVGFSADKVFLMPIKRVEGLQPGARVVPVSKQHNIRIGPPLLGRVINGIGQPLDSKGPLQGDDFLDAHSPDINPMLRHPISETLDVGVRAINALVTVGRGQRLGLMAGSGVGKSVLMGMMTKFTTADVVVVGLIGERGREVKEFIEHILGDEGLRRAVVVASPADEAPLMRLRAAQLASRIAEYYRDKGLNVLLLMDSLTRFAQAQREIALAIGEPPATKGYPPSVFAKIPQLVERAGNAAQGCGSITAFYTVLTEGDDLQDPIADAARAILDGHIVLSRKLAEEGIYPAIDIEASISRAMQNIVPDEHLKLMQRFKQLQSRYQQNRDLIAIGAYAPGADPETDIAIERFPHLRAYIQQGISQAVSMPESLANLRSLLKTAMNSAPQHSNVTKSAGPLAAQHRQ